jgi:hypothetical protein
MDIIQITASLLILGTFLIYTGFGAFPPRIYTEKNTQEKLNLLAAQPRRWVLCQSLVILGGITNVVGAIFLLPLFREYGGALLVVIGVVVFLLGHVFWIWNLGLRTVHPEEFAKNELPGWLFRVYSILVLLGLASFGAAFWLQGIYQVLGAGLFLGALMILGSFLKFKDMPPFVYYAMTLAIGLPCFFKTNKLDISFSGGFQ